MRIEAKTKQLGVYLCTLNISMGNFADKIY